MFLPLGHVQLFGHIRCKTSQQQPICHPVRYKPTQPPRSQAHPTAPAYPSSRPRAAHRSSAHRPGRPRGASPRNGSRSPGSRGKRRGPKAPAHQTPRPPTSLLLHTRNSPPPAAPAPGLGGSAPSRVRVRPGPL